MAKEYNFQYTPLTGRLPGNSFVKQTEQAINELAGIVNEGSAQVEVITNLANTANDNSEEALEKANEALETAGRVYITLPNLDDADSYFDSQLYYFANSYSHNLPVQGTGFLEVKTNDTKTACEQVFIADLTGLCYFRHGTITSAEVGSETVYSVTWDIWSSALASQDYVQQEVNTGIDAANDYTDEQIKQHGNLPVGHEYFSMNPNVPQGSLPLLGGVYSRDTYSDLWAWVQDQTGYLKTEAEWQTLSTANNGNVPYYSSGDGSTTFRVPSLHCWIKGSDGSAQLVGSYLQAGLPNIVGQFGNTTWLDRGQVSNGVFTNSAYSNYAPATGSDDGTLVDFNASRSSSIYGNANTVQPESIVGMCLVKAYGTIVDTGQIDEQAYIDDRYNAMKTYVDGKFLPAVGNAVVGDLSAVQNQSVATTFGPNIDLYKIGRLVMFRMAGTGTLPASQTRYTVATIPQAYLPINYTSFAVVLVVSGVIAGQARVGISEQNGEVYVESNRAEISEWTVACSYISAS